MAYIRNFRQTVPILDWVLFDEGISAFAYTFDVDVASTAGPGDDQGALGDLSSSDPANLFFEGAVARVVGASTYFWFEAQFIGSTSNVTLQRVIYSGTTLSNVVYNGTTVYQNTPETTTTIHAAVSEFKGGQNVANGDIYFAGGWNGSATQSGITRISSSFIKQTDPTALTSAVTWPALAGNNNSIYVGGGITSGTTATSVVNRYSSTGAKQTNLALATAAAELGSATHSTLAMFAGGRDGSTNRSDVGFILASNPGVRSAAGTGGLAVARYSVVGGTATNVIIFAGGRNVAGTFYPNLERYNTSGTRTSTESTTTSGLSVSRDRHESAKCGSGVLFAGGYTGTAFTTSVDLFNSSGTKVAGASALSVARSELAGGNTSTYSFFIGGNASGTVASVIDTYNTSASRLTPTITNLAVGTTAMAGYNNARNDTWALFAGGDIGGGNRINTIKSLRNEMILL